MVTVGGVFTLAALVVLGLFVYPMLLRRGTGGRIGVAVLWLAQVAAGVVFDEGRSSLPAAIAWAALWATLPVVVAMVSVRVGTRPPA